MAAIAAIVMVGMTALAEPASAHDASGDAIVLEMNDERILGTAHVAFEQLGFSDTSGDGLIDASEISEQEQVLAPTFVATVREHVELGIDGEPVQIIGAGIQTPAESASEYVTLAFATGPHDGDVTDVAMDWTFDSSSKEIVLSYEDGAIAGQLSEDGAATFSLGAWAAASSFFALGIDHIRFGPDHLVFLVVLTLAVVGSTVTRDSTWKTVKLVTAFTVGHALSLCLAYFEVISVPAGVIEPLIAISIVIGAALVILGRTGHSRWWIISLVGLIHGLGFASSLGSLGVATSQRVPALAAFNLGIDIAQTAVVLAAVGVLWIASQLLRERAVWVRIPTAAMAGMIGIVWTAERLI